MHTPALLKEIVECFKDIENGYLADGTIGEGNHAKAILSACGKNVKLIAIDRDYEMLELAKKNLRDFGQRVMFFNNSYHNMSVILKDNDIKGVQGILLDLGVSSYHFQNPSRGFSFNYDSPLDMRFDRKSGFTALEVLKNIRESDLAEKLSTLGDIKNSKEIAHEIKDAIRKNKLNTTFDLVRIADSIKPGRNLHKLHPSTILFMITRILTNDELGILSMFLNNITDCLLPGALCAIICYHSGEDKLTKVKFKELSKQGFTLLTKKAIRPKGDEIKHNLKARSARLRIIKKISYD